MHNTEAQSSITKNGGVSYCRIYICHKQKPNAGSISKPKSQRTLDITEIFHRCRRFESINMSIINYDTTHFPNER